MTRENFTERKVETLERLNSISESLTSATRNYYDTSENADLEEIVDRLGADVESIKGHLQQLEDMIGNIEELQCYESNIE
jgi:hypothetical protein